MQIPMDKNQAHALLSSIKPPCLDEGRVAAHVLEHFGFSGEWRVLGGEREQNFRLRTTDGSTYVVKIATPDEDRAGLMFQCEALEHVRRADPDLAVPRVCRTLEGGVLTDITDADGRLHPMRILSFVSGSTILDRFDRHGAHLSLADLCTLGIAHGRLARALQGFRHPAVLRPMPWDIANGLVLGDWLQDFIPDEIRADIRPVLDSLANITCETLSRLRSQIIYHDFHESNVLVRDEPHLDVLGVIDFGDMIFGAVIQDVAVAVASLIHWSPDPVTAAAALVQGYQRHMPLEAADLAVLRELVLARMTLQVALVNYQEKINGRRDEQLSALQALYISAITRLSKISNDAFIASMTPAVVQVSPVSPNPSPVVSMPTLLQRRESVLGKTYTFYNEPLELVRGLGTKLYDASGREYLDCYNNVANVGHCHPYIVEVLARQAATLNTNSRYLHGEIVRLGERLSENLPSHLDTWIFVCTGSEANDLAVRMARSVTGREGVIVTENSYHGNTSVTAPLSLIDYDISDKPNWVETVPAPNVYRGQYRTGGIDLGRQYSDHVTNAAGRLETAGLGAAAILIDSIFDANGALVPPQDYLSQSFERARQAGALSIADEVQMGFGRSGTHMWGFQEFEAEPDFVTMGKPMGNGHPIAAVVTRREIAQEFQQRTGYFNTFGGSTVSAAVANATLDVLLGEKLQHNALVVGAYLKAALDGLAARHEIVGYVHGRGLFLGVELVTDRLSRHPAKLAARWVRERMKSLGVLVSSTGPLGNIVKIRPPMSFSRADADQCFEALEKALHELPSELRK